MCGSVGHPPTPVPLQTRQPLPTCLQPGPFHLDSGSGIQWGRLHIPDLPTPQSISHMRLAG